MLVGAAAMLLALIPLIGIVVGAVAVVLATLALRARQSRSFALVGLVLGVGAVLAAILLVTTLSNLELGVSF